MNAALSGMGNAQSTLEKTAERIAGGSKTAQDSVELTTEAVGMLAARDEFQLNARVFQMADDMQKKVINILA